jgi:uncharacterized protein YggE
MMHTYGFLAMLFSVSSAMAEVPQLVINPSVRSVSVSGSCLRSVPPDRGSITVTSQQQDLDLQKASKRATEGYEKLRQAVLKLKLKDAELRTNEYDLQEVHEWQKDRNVSKGFRARMGLTVITSETTRLGEIITIASQLGMTDVSRLQTFLSPEKQKVERETCLEEAVKNARSKAEAIGKAANAKVGKVLHVIEGAPTANEVQPMFDMAMANEPSARKSQAPPSVEASTIKISVDVSAAFALD